MASLLKELAKRAPNMVVKGPTPEAWETTGKLRREFMYTTMDAMPARVAEASREWAALRAKVAARDITINDIGVGIVRVGELYAFYILGRFVGARSMSI